MNDPRVVSEGLFRGLLGCLGVLLMLLFLCGTGVFFMNPAFSARATQLAQQSRVALFGGGDEPTDEVAVTPAGMPTDEPTDTPTDEPQALNLLATPVDVETVFVTPVTPTVRWHGDSILIAEPGAILNETATFDRGSSTGTHFVQCPEGSFAYASLGHGTFNVQGGAYLELQAAPERLYLVIARCYLTDGDASTDLNMTLQLTGYKPGNILTSPFESRAEGVAYVSADWVHDQLLVSTASGDTGRSDGNCGAEGCQQTYVVEWDVPSGLVQVFEVSPTDVESWELVFSNASDAIDAYEDFNLAPPVDADAR